MATSEESPRIFTPANGFTYARLVLLPFVIGGIVTHHGWFTVVFMLLVWITDLVDGRLARRQGSPTSFGKTLDSVVDFTLIYALFIAFYAAGRVSTLQFAFLYLAMLAILTLQMVGAARGSGSEIVGTALGKLTGALQYAYLIFLVFREVLPPDARWVYWLHTIYFLVLAATIVLFAAECLFKVLDLARASEMAPAASPAEVALPVPAAPSAAEVTSESVTVAETMETGVAGSIPDEEGEGQG